MNTPASRSSTRGFTLIEIMVVIAIIGLIATLVVPGVMNRLDEAKITASEAKAKNLEQAIMDYRRHHDRVPDTLDELLQENERNLNEPYVTDRETLRDAWKTDFLYTKLSSRKYEIVSLGADGVEGGDGADADMSWPKSESDVGR